MGIYRVKPLTMRLCGTLRRVAACAPQLSRLGTE